VQNCPRPLHNVSCIYVPEYIEIFRNHCMVL
jgi:hypothetical protein